MPTVQVQHEIRAPLDIVWTTINNLADFADYMANVSRLVPEPRVGNTRISHWSVLLKGSVLEWSEEEIIDDASKRIDFHQLEGDLEDFTGFWQLSAVDQERTAVDFVVTFSIGIPLLAEMLDPVASRALEQNSRTMLGEIERQVTQAV